MSRDKLVAYLWPERDSEGARNLLKTAVHELRKVLGDSTILSIGDQLSLDTGRLRCDVIEFEAAVAAGDLEAAMKVHAGPFLDGFFLKESTEFEEWAAVQRARLEAMRAQVRERLAARPLPTTKSADVSAPSPVADEAHHVAPVIQPKRTKLAVVAGVVGIAVFSAVAWRSERAAPPLPAPVMLPDSVAGTALLFDGVTSFVGTLRGSVVTSQSDNINVDLMLRWSGRTKNEQQMIFYNGHGGSSGWGLFLTGRENGQQEGTISVLAGGITVVATTLVLKPGMWQHLFAERRDGKVTVTLDDQSYAIGAFPVNPIGGRYHGQEYTSVGSDGTPDKPQFVFLGAIDRLRIRDLASNYFIDRWNFDEGSGPITVGEKGIPLHVFHAKWTPAPRLTPADAFWRRFELICGQAYAGVVTAVPPSDSAAFRAPVVLHLRGCEPNTIRAALEVGVDRSRTFALARTPHGLQLTQELHRQDGTSAAEKASFAAEPDSASFDRQGFVSTSTGGSTGFMLEVVPRDHLTYSRRTPTGLLRIDFDLKRTVVSPPPPWSEARQATGR